jgi:hypothetical protein
VPEQAASERLRGLERLAIVELIDSRAQGAFALSFDEVIVTTFTAGDSPVVPELQRRSQAAPTIVSTSMPKRR